MISIDKKRANVLKSIRYRNNHRDEVNSYRRLHYKRNSERFKLVAKIYRHENKEKITRYRKELCATMKQSGLYKKYYESMKCRFTAAKCHARRKQMEWSIDESNYKELMSKLCSYCDGGLPLHGVGLDRLDNSRGYTISNVVPCCSGCNRIKSDQLTYDEMIVAMKAIKEFRFKKILSEVK